MNTRIYNPINSARLWLIALVAVVGMASCSSTKHSYSTSTVPSVSQQRLALPNDSQGLTGAAAQATSSTTAPVQSDSEDELLASNAPISATAGSQNKLKEKLLQLNGKLAEAKYNQA